MHTCTVLPHNLRLITVPSKSTKAVTILILVGSGSRYESDSERGIAHFLEHMFFKGGERFDTPQKVSGTIDRMGADFNAFTGKEYAGYYVKCASRNIETACDVLGDMLLNTKLDIADIDRERGVIIEELNMYEDMPSYQIGWDFEKLLFGDTPMGRDQIGLPETIHAFTPEDFRTYREDLYTPDNTVIIISGDITISDSEALVRKYFPFENTQKSRNKGDSPVFLTKKQVHIRAKKTEQAHLVIGFPGVPYRDPDQYAMRMLSTILGGNMSSRMFLSIREAKGLCYSISTSTDHYSDTGIISTHLGVDLKRTHEAIRAICDEYRKIADKGVTEEELQNAKQYFFGKMTLRTEDSEELASFCGVQALLTDEILSLEELFARVEAVTTGDIHRVAQKFLVPEKCFLSAIGPFEGQEEEFQKIIQKW